MTLPAVRTPALGILVLLCLLFAPAGGRAQDRGYLDELIETARQKRLAEDRQWLTLGHYLPDWLGTGVTSVIDSPGFFNAADGRSDPRAELEATLARFFAGDEDRKNLQHPQCAYMARYRWLKAQLGFDPARLPEQPCLAFEEWIQVIDPAQVTLIFPAAYLNQPSSMFGHTLLRIDKPGQTERTRLSSYAINFAAATGEDAGMLFALKGIVGLYPGAFSILPYYDKVKDYSDLENRDIWEYQLTLKPAEIRRMLMHVWELGQEYANYFFFDQNCSYQLLSLLEVARPELDLTSRFLVWAIPSDTVKAVVEQAGLLKRTVYRPSARSEIEHRLSLLEPRQRSLALQLATGARGLEDAALAALPDGERAAVLELAYEYLQLRFRAKDVTREVSAPRSLALLRARAVIDTPSPVPPVPEPEVRPDQGHGSARASLGVGRLDGRNFLQLGLRPSYHDLLDPQAGFLAGSEVAFFDLVLRYYEDSSLVNLESMTALEIQSISPRNRYFEPLSWRFDIGVERFRREGEAKGDLVGTASGGAGFSYGLWDGAVITALGNLRVQGAPDLPDDVLIGAGPSLGLLYGPTDWWTLKLHGAYEVTLNRGSDDYIEARLDQSFTLGRSLALRLETAYRGDTGDPFAELIGSLQVYF
jgi:hypothetical protein